MVRARLCVCISWEGLRTDGMMSRMTLAVVVAGGGGGVSEHNMVFPIGPGD